MPPLYQASVTNKDMEVKKKILVWPNCSVGIHLFVPSAFSVCLFF